MPQYIYKCTKCEFKDIVALPMSFDPSVTLRCEHCQIDSMTRRMGSSHSFNANTRRTLGQWYKENTGKELLGGE